MDVEMKDVGEKSNEPGVQPPYPQATNGKQDATGVTNTTVTAGTTDTSMRVTVKLSTPSTGIAIPNAKASIAAPTNTATGGAGASKDKTSLKPSVASLPASAAPYKSGSMSAKAVVASAEKTGMTMAPVTTSAAVKKPKKQANKKRPASDGRKSGYVETSQNGGDDAPIATKKTASSKKVKKKKGDKDKKKAADNDVSVGGNRRGGKETTSKKSKKKGGKHNNGLSSYQHAVAEMMQRALEEDQYSNVGSVVETDSSDDEDHYRNIVVVAGGAGNSVLGGDSRTHTIRLDRSMLMHNMRKRAIMEGRRSTMIGGNVVEVGGKKRAFEDATEVNAGEGSNASMAAGSAAFDSSNEDKASGGRGKKKKRKKGKRGGARNAEVSGSVNANGYDADVAKGDSRIISDTGDEDDDIRSAFGDESSVFGQTTGSTNSTWIQCDKCGKWRRLRGVVDVKKLPSKWYCSMNKKDPDRAKCSAPEEEYDAAPNTPESLTDQRTRKHLRLWVRRLQCMENYEARLPTMTRGKKRNHTISSKEPYEWVRCCNPSCGKWRALLRSMDSSSVTEAARNGEWYCVMNTWDEKTASCAAPQENLPAIGCPPWVQIDRLNDEKVGNDNVFE